MSKPASSLPDLLTDEEMVLIIYSTEGLSIYFYFTAAGVVPCGSRKKPPCISCIVQIIFYLGVLRSEGIF